MDLHTVGPPRLTICGFCVGKVEKFLWKHGVQERQPFLNLFQGMLQESDDGTQWIMYPASQMAKEQGLYPIGHKVESNSYSMQYVLKALGEESA